MATTKSENPLDQFQPYLKWGAMGAFIFAILALFATLLSAVFGVDISRWFI